MKHFTGFLICFNFQSKTDQLLNFREENWKSQAEKTLRKISKRVEIGPDVDEQSFEPFEIDEEVMDPSLASDSISFSFGKRDLTQELREWESAQKITFQRYKQCKLKLEKY